MALHKSVCPETMRPMHERMERELFAEFNQKYGAPAAPANVLVWTMTVPVALLHEIYLFRYRRNQHSVVVQRLEVDPSQH